MYTVVDQTVEQMEISDCGTRGKDGALQGQIIWNHSAGTMNFHIKCHVNMKQQRRYMHLDQLTKYRHNWGGKETQHNTVSCGILNQGNLTSYDEIAVF